MNNPSTLEERLHEYSQAFPYPPTPAIHRAVRIRLIGRRPISLRPALRWVILAVIVLCAALMAVPRVRAQVLEFLRFGVVRIFPAAPAPAPSGVQIPLTGTPRADGAATPRADRTATPRPTFAPQLEPESITSLQGLAGETTLQEARDEFRFPILLPSYPADLGEPDRVFLQERDQMVILAWLDPSAPDRARLSLHEIAPGSVLIEKYQPPLLEQTRVHESPAAWVSGPYLLQVTSGDVGWRRLVEGNALIWEAGGITYRLESPLSLEETLKIAESLQ